MRFHHSTRRGRTKFSQGGGAHHGGSGGRSTAGHSALSNRWAQLSYCRQTNIHFNRRLPVEVPDDVLRATQVELASPICSTSSQPAANSNPINKLVNSSGRLEAQQIAAIDLEQQLESLNFKNEQQSKQLHRQQDDEILASNSLGDDMTKTNRNERAIREGASSPMQMLASGKQSDTSKRETFARNKLDIESAREKLIAQVEKHPFWSNKAAKRMRLLNIDERRILVYELVSYCEARDLEWRYEPYRGGLVAGANSSAAAAIQSAGLVNRTLSSVGERVPMHSAHDTMIDAHTAGSANKLLSNIGSISQPASPMRQALINSSPATPGPLMCPNSKVPPSSKRDEFTYEIGATGGTSLALPASAMSASSIRRQAIRRSCSASVTPVQNNTPPTTLSPTHALKCVVGATSFGEPRPLPSAQLVWSIEPPEHHRPSPFVSYVHTSEVPESSFVKRCHGCQGRGRLKCTSCYGVGYEVCISCSGKGTMRSLASTNSGVGGAGGRGQQRRDSSAGVVGSMWANAEAGESMSSSSRSTGSRHDEPGGISGGGSASAVGAWTTESCHFCHGAGQKRCWICAGRAYNTCTACAGTGQLRCYLNLNITWLNHRDECVLNNTDAIIPRERLKMASGLLLADEVATRLEPIAGSQTSAQLRLASLLARQSENSSSMSTAASGGDNSNLVASGSRPQLDKEPVPLDGATPSGRSSATRYFDTLRPLEQMVRPNELSQLNSLSIKLLEKHAATHERNERLLRQRQRVTQIECYLVNWEWKRRRGHFVIYGDEHKVYIAKYPFKSICNIT